MSLSKTLFLKGVQCCKRLWLYQNRKELIPSEEAKKALYDEGILIGKLARSYFPDGNPIAEEYVNLKNAISQTESAIKSGSKILFEPAVRFDDVLIRADILKRANGSKSWDLIEVKGSTEVKEIHLPDVAIQYYVLQGAGLEMTKVYLMLIDTDYCRRGEVEVKKLFKFEDVTKEVKKYLPTVPQTLKEFRRMLSKRKAPEIDIGAHCEDPYECEFIPHCWEHIPDYSIFNLTRAKWDKKEELYKHGIIEIDKIPDDVPLTEAQQLQVSVEKTGEEYINKREIKELLSELKYPLYFLDFETINPAIPPYDGLHPYEKIPFQFSLRIYDKERGLKHIEFLGDGREDPRPEAARLLAENISSKGSVIVYSSFEKGVLQNLANLFPKHERALLSARDRIWDLYVPFSQRHYVHPKFHGSASIKAVLPALVPSMSYKGMEISDGGQALQAYLDLMTGELNEKESSGIREALLTYCGQDTLAMVKILEILMGL